MSSGTCDDYRRYRALREYMYYNPCPGIHTHQTTEQLEDAWELGKNFHISRWPEDPADRLHLYRARSFYLGYFACDYASPMLPADLMYVVATWEEYPGIISDLKKHGLNTNSCLGGLLDDCTNILMAALEIRDMDSTPLHAVLQSDMWSAYEEADEPSPPGNWPWNTIGGSSTRHPRTVSREDHEHYRTAYTLLQRLKARLRAEASTQHESLDRAACSALDPSDADIGGMARAAGPDLPITQPTEACPVLTRVSQDGPEPPASQRANEPTKTEPTQDAPPFPCTKPMPLKHWAETFGVSENTVAGWFQRGEVKARKIGRSWAVDISELPADYKPPK